jgi:hypothetical protein
MLFYLNLRITPKIPDSSSLFLMGGYQGKSGNGIFPSKAILMVQNHHLLHPNAGLGHRVDRNGFSKRER